MRFFFEIILYLKSQYFKEKSQIDEGWINGGFFVIEPKIFKFIKNDETVFEKEPLDLNHPFLETKNLLITPHLGASTIEAKEGVSKGICQQVKDFLILI